ncbi:MAG: hypothetical protein IJE05_03370 [Clostridia bacterium]|nr:hypothetical protein [Clostridia bacterium]
MANRKENYKDMEKWRKALNAQKKRYYSKTAIYKPSTWTLEHDRLILEHNATDAELSKIIKHSVNAIQKRRCRLKKMLKENN